MDIDIDLDTALREVSMPPDFAAALDTEPEARRTFDRLSYSNKSWHVLQSRGGQDRRDTTAPHRGRSTS